MKRHTPSSQAGFTLIELLMAMAVFSFMLMIVSFGFIQVVRIHQGGIASRTTQQNARLVIDNIVKEVRVSAKATAGSAGTVRWLCLDQSGSAVQYAVNTDITNPANGVLRRAAVTSGACNPPPANFATNAAWTSINDTSTGGVVMSQFLVTTTPPLDPGLGTAMITVTLVSKNNLTALDATKTHCLPGAGSQFCSVTTLSSGASLRGGNGL